MTSRTLVLAAVGVMAAAAVTAGAVPSQGLSAGGGAVHPPGSAPTPGPTGPSGGPVHPPGGPGHPPGGPTFPPGGATHPPGGPPGPTAPPGGGLLGEAWAWTQLTSRGTQIRYVTTDPARTCPVVRYTLNGARNPFALHRVSLPMGAQFPTTVCELGVPLGASDAVLESSTIHAATVHPANLRLPLPNWTATTRPRTVAVIGDTGCLVPTGGPVQDCANHQTGWPFPTIATSAATVSRPDLVVHVGDYLYREDPGRANDTAANPGCTTFADRASWPCVVADFFRPAETLLATAPVALTRGNHEDCNPAQVGGAGGAWFRYLADDLRDNGTCSLYSPPVVLRAGTLNLVSVDSAYADPMDDGTITTDQRTRFAQQFAILDQDARQHPAQDYFLFTHKPLWMVRAAGTAQGAVTWVTHVLDAAVAATPSGRLADNIRLVLSGHIHLYQMLAFGTSRPPQVTVGASGGLPLDNGPDDTKVVGQPVGTPPQAVTQSITQAGVFGYAVLRDNAGTWDLTFHDPVGTRLGQVCTLATSTTAKGFTCHA